jgi:TATA-binding protein-associated factor
VLTIALLGGAAWFYFQYGGSSGSDGSSGSGSKRGSSSSSSSKDVDLNDPLAEARRIMDKYKK